MNSNTDRKYRIGEIYFIKFDGSGSEQTGYRPGLIFQNNTGNEHSPNVIALPLTTSLKKQKQPTHVVVRAEDSGLLRDSMVLCENPQRMAKENIGKYITTLSDEYMAEIAQANLLATSAIAFIDPTALKKIWGNAVALNMVMPSLCAAK